MAARSASGLINQRPARGPPHPPDRGEANEAPSALARPQQRPSTHTDPGSAENGNAHAGSGSKQEIERLRANIDELTMEKDSYPAKTSEDETAMDCDHTVQRPH